MLGRIEVLVQGVGRVDRFEFLGCIFAGVFEDYFLAAGVFYSVCKYSIVLQQPARRLRPTRQELSDIICLSMHNDPARVLVVVLRDVLACKFSHCIYSEQILEKRKENNTTREEERREKKVVICPSPKKERCIRDLGVSPRERIKCCQCAVANENGAIWPSILRGASGGKRALGRLLVPQAALLGPRLSSYLYLPHHTSISKRKLQSVFLL